MRIRILALLPAAAALALVPRTAAAQGEFHWKGKIAPGKAIEIKGVNGDVRGVAGSGDVEVTAVKHARRSDPDDVKIEVVQHEDGVTICAVYPSDGRRENTCDAGKGGHMNVQDNDVTVDFTVRVPAGVRFLGNTVNGDVSYDGTIKDGGRYRFTTHDGDLRVSVPEKASVTVTVSTFDGDFSACFPVQLSRKSKHRFDLTIGAGSARVELESFNGDIHLCRPGQVMKPEGDHNHEH